MSLGRRFLRTNRNAEDARSSLEDDRPPSYAFIDTMAPMHTQADSVDSPNDRAWDVSVDRDPVVLSDETESSLMNTLGVAETSNVRYVYYRIYAEDGAIPSETPVAHGDPFLGRINARYVPPPHTAKAVKRSISKVENFKDCTITSLFLTPYTQSPIGDADEITILNCTGPGSTPQEPLALVAKISESERSALESGGRDELASAQVAEPPEIRYLYYQLYADDYIKPSKVAIDPEEPFLGRIRADSVAPPHSPASIKRCISRVEETPTLTHADLFADISCKTPLKEDYISIHRTDGPGLSPNKPMAIVLDQGGVYYRSGFGQINGALVSMLWVTRNFCLMLASPQSPVLVATGANVTNSNEATNNNNSNAALVDRSIFSSMELIFILVVGFLLLYFNCRNLFYKCLLYILLVVLVSLEIVRFL